MINTLELLINEKSSLPKYKQIVSIIINEIELGNIKFGQKLPSINNLSFECYLSRDTVEKAYGELKKRGVIISVKGKGFYVNSSAPKSRSRILILFNKLSDYKKMIYNSMAETLRNQVDIDFFIYHYDFEMFKRILNEHPAGYKYYLIMPHFLEYDRNELFEVLSKIPKERLILMDHLIDDYSNIFGAVYQNFKMDICGALSEAMDLLSKYSKLVFFFPTKTMTPYPKDILVGFRRFCALNSIEFEHIEEVDLDYKVSQNVAYLTIAPNDLVYLIKLIRATPYKLGEDIGIISYNETPLKEVLEKGITVVSTDFKKMGELVGQMISDNDPQIIENDFHLIRRNSL